MTQKTKIGSCQSLYWSGFSYEPMSVEVDISRGLFYFNIVGLADKTMMESKYRILSALRNSEFDMPQKKNEKVVVSLLPANTKKAGTYADIAIAFSYLIGSRQLPHIKKDKSICCIGEIRLEGSVMVKQDIVHMFQAGIRAGMKKFIVPRNSTKHFNLLPGIQIMEIDSLTDLRKPLVFLDSEELAALQQEGFEYEYLEDNELVENTNDISSIDDSEKFKIDKLIGLGYQKRALMIGLAGNHHMLFSGLPGCGKSALADCADELLDTLTGEEAIETYAIHQAVRHSGNMQIYELSFKRPMRKPHATIHAAGLIGDGNGKPGELSLAHNGTIILNELCEFSKEVIECLRDPIENQRLLVHKHGHGIEFKLHTTIIATTNICPCGKIPTDIFSEKELGSDPEKKSMCCKCTIYQISRYQYKISEPLLDRFPIVCTFAYEDLKNKQGIVNEEYLSGLEIKKRIARAREIQRERNGKTYNQYIKPEKIIKYGLTPKAQSCRNNLEKDFDLSKRKIGHVLRVARTIADIDNEKKIDERHLLEAASYVNTKPFELLN